MWNSMHMNGWGALISIYMGVNKWRTELYQRE